MIKTSSKAETLSERIFTSAPGGHESARPPITHINQKMQKISFYPAGETFPIKRVQAKNELVSALVRLLTFSVGTKSRLISAKNISIEDLNDHADSVFKDLVQVVACPLYFVFLCQQIFFNLKNKY